MTSHKEPLIAGMAYERHDEIVVMRCTRCGASWHVEGAKPALVRQIAKAHEIARHGHDG